MRRLAVAGLCIGLLALDGALWSHAFATGEVLTARLQFFPERMQGETITLPLVKVVDVRDGGYTVRQGRFDYQVTGDPGELEVGVETYVRGTFSGTDQLAEEWHILAPKRGGKKLLGFIGLAIAGLVTLAGARPAPGGLRLRG